MNNLLPIFISCTPLKIHILRFSRAMEPMTLGSPTHSPPGSPNTSYLPPFLMGEFNQPSTPRTGSLSPTKRSPFAFGMSNYMEYIHMICMCLTPLIYNFSNVASCSNFHTTRTTIQYSDTFETFQ